MHVHFVLSPRIPAAPHGRLPTYIQHFSLPLPYEHSIVDIWSVLILQQILSTCTEFGFVLVSQSTPSHRMVIIPFRSPLPPTYNKNQVILLFVSPSERILTSQAPSSNPGPLGTHHDFLDWFFDILLSWRARPYRMVICRFPLTYIQ